MKILNCIILINLFYLKYFYVRPHPDVKAEKIKNVSKILTIKSQLNKNPYGSEVVGNDSIKNSYSFVQRRVKRSKGTSKVSAIEKPKSSINDTEKSDRPKGRTKRSPRLNINRKNRNNISRNSRKSNTSRTGKINIRRGSKTIKVPIRSHDEDNEEDDGDEGEEEPAPKKRRLSPKAKENIIGAASKIAEYGIPIAAQFTSELIKNNKRSDPSNQGKKGSSSEIDSDLDKAILGDTDDDLDLGIGSKDFDEKNVVSPSKKSKVLKRKGASRKAEIVKNDEVDDIFGMTKEGMGKKEDEEDEDINLGSDDQDDEYIDEKPKKKSVSSKENDDEEEDLDFLDDLEDTENKVPVKKSKRTDNEYSDDHKTKGAKHNRHNRKTSHDEEDEDEHEEEEEYEPKKKFDSKNYDEEEPEEERPPKRSKNYSEEDYENTRDSEGDENEKSDEFEYDNGDSENQGEDDKEESDEQDHDEYTKKFKIPSGLEYLGAGYDLVKGNPMGDNITLLDPGYKSSVIQMHWNKNIENISNSLKYLQPVGGWIRPYSSCHKVETVNEINSSDSILKSLSADASVSFSLPGDSLKFAASAKYKKLDDASKSGTSKMFINKSYCFKYVAGISTSLPWDFTLGFQSSLDRLVDSFQGLEHDSKCKPYIYREEPNNEHCDEMGITDWMELFNTFGTHVATKIYLGGKIFTTMEVKKNQEEKLSDQGLDVKAILSAQIKNTNIDSNVQVSVIKSNNSKDNLLDTKKSTFVLGGDIYGKGKRMDFIEWSKSVSDHPMPIKAEFTPISHFMKKSLREAYNAAYLYYGKVILESDFLRYQAQMELSPEEFIKQIDIEHTSGSGMINLKCKDGKSIQFGFVITTLKDKRHEVTECPTHKSECSSPLDDQIVYSTIWIGCRSDNLINLNQIVTKHREPACDSGYNILLGSYFFDSKSNYLLMKPCKLGENKCDTEGDVEYTWMVCTKKFWQLNSKSKVVKKSESSSISCSPGETISFGMSVEWTKDSDKKTFPSIYPCKRDEPTCEHRCKNRCNRIVQYIVCK